MLLFRGCLSFLRVCRCTVSCCGAPSRHRRLLLKPNHRMTRNERDICHPLHSAGLRMKLVARIRYQSEYQSLMQSCRSSFLQISVRPKTHFFRTSIVPASPLLFFARHSALFANNSNRPTDGNLRLFSTSSPVSSPHPSLMASATTFYDFTPKDKRGQEHPLSQYKGKVVLAVNTASKCGFTPQFAPGSSSCTRRYLRNTRVNSSSLDSPAISLVARILARMTRYKNFAR